MNSFQSVLDNKAIDRHFGGSDASIIADPYISGYHYTKWVKLPDILPEWVKAGDGALAGTTLSGTAVIQDFLQGSCISVTPPGGTLNKTEFQGIGGIKWAVPTNIDYTNSVTLRFIEFSHLPVTNIISGWVRMIRDMKTGTSALGNPGGEYTKANYAGTLFYWTTRPDGKTVEYSACYTGVFPSKDPQDLFTGDVNAIDKLEIDIDFNVDWIWHEQWVHAKCQEFADNIGEQNKSMDGFRGGHNPGDGVDESAKG